MRRSLHWTRRMGRGVTATVIVGPIVTGLIVGLAVERLTAPSGGAARGTGSSNLTAPTSTLGLEQTTGARMEGQLTVANVTVGDTNYVRQLSANANDTLQFQGWYYNMEDTNSGRYVANLTVRFVLSTTRSTDQVATVYISGENTRGVVSSATVTVPRNHVLQFVPGSGIWRHNVLQDDVAPNWVNTPVADEVVRAGVRLHDAGPCLMCEANVVLRARVVPG